MHKLFEYIKKISEENKWTADPLERLAAIEHEQWVAWAKDILKTENISVERAERWQKLFIPYAQLTEEQKDKDRVWANKVLEELEHIDGDKLLDEKEISSHHSLDSHDGDEDDGW